MLAGLWHWTAGVFGHIGDISPYSARPRSCAEDRRVCVPRARLAEHPPRGVSEGEPLVQDCMGRVTRRDRDQRRDARAGRDRDDDRHLPDQHPGSSVAGVTSATIVQALFFTALSVVIVVLTGIFRPHTVSKGSPARRERQLLRLSSVRHPAHCHRTRSRTLLRLAAAEAEAAQPVAQGQARRRDLRATGDATAVRSRCPRVRPMPAGSASTSCSWPASASGHRVHRVSRCVVAHAVRAVRDHSRRRRTDAALDVATLRELRDLEQHRRVLDHAGRDPDDLERRPRHRRHALGVRLRSGEADALEERAHGRRSSSRAPDQALARLPQAFY